MADPSTNPAPTGEPAGGPAGGADARGAGAGFGRGPISPGEVAAYCAMTLAVGAAFGLVAGRRLADARPGPYEAPAELKEGLEPHFRRYLRDGPGRTGRLPLPGGGSVPVEGFAGPGSDYFLIPLAEVGGPHVSRWWQLGIGWEIIEYRRDYALAALDPALAARLLDDAPDRPADADAPPPAVSDDRP